MRHSLLALIPAASLAFAAAAPARDADELPRRAVRVLDLDLSRRADVERLYARLEWAVSTLCPAPAGDVARWFKARACHRDVLQRAVDRAGIPLLAEIHRARTRDAAPDRLAHR